MIFNITLQFNVSLVFKIAKIKNSQFGKLDNKRNFDSVISNDLFCNIY